MGGGKREIGQQQPLTIALFSYQTSFKLVNGLELALVDGRPTANQFYLHPSSPSLISMTFTGLPPEVRMLR